MTWFLDLRAQSTGGGPAADVGVRKDGVVCDPNLLIQALRGQDVLLATHGFNVNRADGMTKLAAWESVLRLGTSALFVGVLWPGDSSWLPVLDYPMEGNEAISSGRLLAPFLDKNFGNAASISLASHSLGARVVLETIRQLKTINPRKLTLMAGAINDDCLTDEYQDAAAKVGEISVLASSEDYVLEFAFPVGNPVSGIITQGHPYWHGALGREGPTPQGKVRAGWHITDDWNFGHGDYVGGQPPAMKPTADVPADGTPTPKTKPNWSAAFVSGRFR